jgi:Dolichyl-phosphate-mannose-protein mannosyltransferase
MFNTKLVRGFSVEKRSLMPAVLLITPLIISCFTHVWNPLGFPTMHVDEGHYMRRAMQLLEGLGPQEPTTNYVFAYDHPYFGQLFLAASLSLIGYPDSLTPTVGNEYSIEMLYLVPRILIGMLAVIDTFLVYKIAETRYNRRIAFIAATLFAVMPLSWMLRGIFLDSILLPFFLLSILFAIYSNKVSNHNSNLGNLLVLLSGIFLGIAIFTKAPLLFAIPLIIFLLIEKNKFRRKKRIALGAIPIFLIPLIWPAYAVWTGGLNEWLNGILYQLERESVTSLSHSLSLVYQIDPVLLIISLAGLAYSVVRRDFFPLLWIAPFLIFFYRSGWVTHFHWIILLPALCIASALLFDIYFERIKSNKFLSISRYVVLSAVLIFGLTSTVALITANLNSSYFQLYSYVVGEVQDLSTNYNYSSSNDPVTIVGGHRVKALTWIPQYVFNYPIFFRDIDNPFDRFASPINTKDIIFVADGGLRARFYPLIYGDNSMDAKTREVSEIYYNATTVATFKDRTRVNQYPAVNVEENHGLGHFVEVREKH